MQHISCNVFKLGILELLSFNLYFTLFLTLIEIFFENSNSLTQLLIIDYSLNKECNITW